ncbi:MAG: hypothetical protein KZQ94_10405 [Candidatus Thiodiazotropha sp. (ex Troendleina suluensis)]|nr:hypothetical protein [Candidatus Thiodiazotropha sp. (ex Troendleina suluensis)]
MRTERHGYAWLIVSMFAALVALMLFNISNAMAATYDGGLQLPTTRVDGEALPLSEIESATIECGHSDAGPFDAHSVTLTQLSQTMPVSMEMPENRDYWCRALVTDTDGQVSGPSNVVMQDYKRQPGTPTLETFHMVINLTLTVP